MTDDHMTLQARVLLALQGALLGAVTPDLRGVTVELVDGVLVRFVYAGHVDDEIRDRVDIVETEMIADLYLETTVRSAIESVPGGPIPMRSTEVVAFHRAETDGWEKV